MSPPYGFLDIFNFECSLFCVNKMFLLIKFKKIRIMILSLFLVLANLGTKQRLILELVQMLLNKVLADGALLEMTNQVSGVVLLLMTALRQTYDSNKTDADKDSSAYVTILDEGRSKEASKLYSSALQVDIF